MQRQLSRLNVLIIDKLGFVPLSTTGIELLFEVFIQRQEQGLHPGHHQPPFRRVYGGLRTGGLTDAEILERLLALNLERAAAEQ